jgi:MYXO-CTERM domain-containing protein
MRKVLVVSAAALLLAPASASAAGGGLFPSYGGQGATAPGSPFTYVAVPAKGGVVIQAVRKDGGAIDRWRNLPAGWGTALVAYDGSMTGLSADHKTLVLVNSGNNYPPTRTKLLVLRASNFKTRDTVTIKGFSSLDAISPDGRWAYLVHYTDPRKNPEAYEVRAYDLRRHRLDPKPVIDPREPDEDMVGTPMSRLASPDGRWQYTLYQGEEPFVHALDTVGKTAACIDLPQLEGLDLSATKLRLSGTTLRVGQRVQIDTRTNEVVKFTPAAAPVRATPTATPVQKKSDGSAWPYALLGLPLLALVAFVLRRKRSVEYVIDEKAAVDVPEQEPALRQ